MTLVKICGVSESRHARAAASLGADFIGIVFAPSRRQVTLGQAQAIARALGQREPPSSGCSAREIEGLLRRRRPLLVGVFADQDADTINAIAEEIGLDLVQLSGREPWEMCRTLVRPVLKCMKVREGQAASEIVAEIDEGGIALLDPYVEGTYGGTGKRLDWSVAAAVAQSHTIVLAGGLSPENVAEAVRLVQPWAVDVSSGVETGGVKDVGKIRAFVQAAKGAGQADREVIK